ncbi:MAG: HAD family hydrolase [Promethearchaeota archaeon]
MKDYNKVVLSFDLDNTLINNREGIVNSFNFALRKFNLPLMDRQDIEKMIGIPLHQMFLTITKENITDLVFAFREFYGSKGIYQGHLIMGVEEKLRELKKQGFILGIITSKKQEMAKRMVDILAISEFFDYIIGETEERIELGKLDPSLKSFFEDKYPNYQIIVIGDHPKDAMLSNNLMCPFIGVLTGNHSAQELMHLKKGIILILKSVRELSKNDINELLR